MFLPEYVKKCIDTLENAGFSAYAVGGCVRDSLLGLTPHDYDLCTSALPEEMEAVFAGCKLVLAGKKHGTVGVITEGGVVEITTYRTEGEYRDNRHPEWVKFVPDVEADLSRRDFTVNAMAWSPYRGFADPFGGRKDLKNQILQAVGDPETRFREDSLRILRGVRFAVKYHLCVENATAEAMVKLSALMDNLARERVMEELCKLLPLVSAQDLLTFAPVLSAAIPELAPMVGFDQRNSHHVYDLYTHTAHVVANTPADLTLRWAALLHDTGKLTTFTLDSAGQGHFYGHAKESAQIADAVLRRLKAPTRLREDVVTLIELHMIRIEPTKKVVRRWLSRVGTETIDRLLVLMAADMAATVAGISDTYIHFDEIRSILAEIEKENACLSLKDLAVNGHDLMAIGLSGPQIGKTMNRLLELVLDEQIENTKDALLAAAQQETL